MYPLFDVPLLLSSPRSHWEPLPGHRLMKKTLEISHLRRRKTLCYIKSPPTRGRGEVFFIDFIDLCIFYFFYTTTLYFIFTYKGKITKIVKHQKKKQQNCSLHSSFNKREKKPNKQTNRQTNRTVKVLNLLIYRAPPTVHFHRIVHSFKEGRSLIETISFSKCLKNYGLLQFAFLFPQYVELFVCTFGHLSAYLFV